MCKKKFLFRELFFISGLLILSGIGMAGFSKGAAPDLDGFTPQVGEVLEYKMILKSVIHGANQTVKILSKEEFEGHQVLNIRSNLTSVGLVKSLSNYSETEDIKIDAESFYPRWIRREIHNGGKQQLEEVYFNYETMTAERELTRTDGSSQKVTLKLPGMVQDGVSLPFFFRKGLGRSPNHVFFYSEGSITEVVCQITLCNTPVRLKSGNYTGYYQFTDPDSQITIMIGSQGARVPFLIRMIATFGKIESQLVKLQ
ncbi:MAG TPA: DUF3108 domain-containing protein [Bacillota bacterium]|nr:DUF3108 domain-containing protein [Bacillota bacterium]